MIVFLIVMVVYQQIENYVLQPTIIGKAARISGFTVLASVLAFGALFGVIGAIIGVPIAAALQIVMRSSPPPGELASPPRTPPGRTATYARRDQAPPQSPPQGRDSVERVLLARASAGIGRRARRK